MPCRSFHACLCLLGLTVGAAHAQPAPRYAITDLGTLPGGGHSAAYGINNAGQIVGWSDGGTEAQTSSPPDDLFIHNHAVVWDKGRILDLGLLKGSLYDAALAINSRGQVVGGEETHYKPFIDGGIAGPRQTFLWQHGQMTVFNGALPVSSIADLMGINDKGEMVGAGFPNNLPRRPVLWFRGKLTDLGLFPRGREGIANGINNKSEIVGWVMMDNPPATNALYWAFLYRRGKLIDLGTYPIVNGPSGHALSGDVFSEAYAINDKGQIVGTAANVPALWERGKTYLLVSITENYIVTGTAYAINNKGQIVGTAGGDLRSYKLSPQGGDPIYQGSAFLYQNRTFQYLNDLVPAGSGWVLQTARGINDRGQIVGSGEHDGKDHAYLLTPLP